MYYFFSFKLLLGFYEKHLVSASCFPIRIPLINDIIQKSSFL